MVDPSQEVVGVEAVAWLRTTEGTAKPTFEVVFLGRHRPSLSVSLGRASLTVVTGGGWS